MNKACILVFLLSSACQLHGQQKQISLEEWQMHIREYLQHEQRASQSQKPPTIRKNNTVATAASNVVRQVPYWQEKLIRGTARLASL